MNLDFEWTDLVRNKTLPKQGNLTCTLNRVKDNGTTEDQNSACTPKCVSTL